MTNNLSDLNSHLFDQLNRLADKNLTTKDFEQEVKRAGAMVSVADQISKNTDLRLKTAKLYAQHGPSVLEHLPQIGGPKE